MAPRRKVPLAKVIDFEMERLRRRADYTMSTVEGPSSGVFPSERLLFGVPDQEHHQRNAVVSGDENGSDASGRQDCPSDNQRNRS